MSNVLIIGDTHIPFEHRDYLEFCVETKKKYRCKIVIHIGDLTDAHSISFHDHDPDGMSPIHEFGIAKERLRPWFRAFPNVLQCMGNHDRMVDRKGKTAGLPSQVFKPYRDIWGFPRGWENNWHYIIDGVKYMHGTNHSGDLAHKRLAITNRMSTVIGHLHSVAGVEWSANEENRIFGMSVGCGVDRKTYAFAYGKDMRYKPILSCGVMLEDGAYPMVIPMEL